MIGVFGSAFNPPSRGHLDAIEQALAQCEAVWLVPAIDHAFGKEMLDFELRWAMLQAFVTDIGDPRVQPCRIEAELWDAQHPVYTCQVMRALQERHPDQDFAFLCGPDNWAAFDRFAGAEEIRRRWPVIVLAERQAIRSTQIRLGHRAGQDISAWVTPRVATFLTRQRLYD